MKPIAGYPNYCVTTDGRVWSKPRRDSLGRACGGEWMRLCRDRGGYAYVRLCQDGERYTHKVHRLVLETFVGPCPPGLEGCHNNGDPADNRLENLRWDTRSANAKDAVRHGTSGGFQSKGHTYTQGEGHGNAKLSESRVRQIVEQYRTGRFLQREIAGRYGVDRCTVSRIVTGKRWRHLQRIPAPPRVEAAA